MEALDRAPALVVRPPRLAVEPDLVLERALPTGSQVLVSVGDMVDPTTVIAEGSAEDRLHIVKLEIDEDGVVGTVVKNVGEECRRGETVCFHEYLFGLGWKEYLCPADGTVDSFDPVGGFLVIREHPRPVRALLPGRVLGVEPGLSVTLTTAALRLRGAAGAGGPGGGVLLLLDGAGGPGRDAAGDARNAAGDARDAAGKVLDLAGKVVAVPRTVTYEFLLQAVTARAAGVICDTARWEDLVRLQDYLAGLTTGELLARSWFAPDGKGGAAGDRSDRNEEVSLPVVCLAGYGRPGSDPELWARLNRLEGLPVYLDGRMSAGGEPREPEVIVALDPAHLAAELEAGPRAPAEPPAWVVRARPGQRVRVVSGPWAGRTGVVTGLPDAPLLLPGGRAVRAAVVRFGEGPDGGPDGGEASLPLMNLEAEG